MKTPTLFLSSMLALTGMVSAQGGQKREFFDPQDGWLDLSEFIEKPHGFIPLVVPVTEPAVGYGAAFVPVFIRPGGKTETGKTERPQIFALGGMMTENGSEGIVGLHKGNWFDDRLETLVAGLDASVNLDFHGIGDDLKLSDDPLRYNLDVVGGMVQGRTKVGNTDWWVGGRYMRGEVEASLVRPDDFPDIIPSRTFKTDIGGLTLLLNHDTYNNVFTPTRGHLWELDVSFYDPALGAGDSWQIVDAVAIHYWPASKNVTIGLRNDLHAAYGNTPFFMLPSIQLRGVPAMSMQGDAVASAELEARWQIHSRFSLLAFSGAGAAWLESNDFNRVATTVSGGLGFRYLISRRFGLHMGADVGISEGGDPAVYVQFGNAWLRP